MLSGATVSEVKRERNRKVKERTKWRKPEGERFGEENKKRKK